MRITAVTICLLDPCRLLTVNFNMMQKCQSFNFFPVVSGVTGSVIGYRWDFGDGTYSNLAYPNHFYATPGVYSVSLLVYTKSDDGKCCKKIFRKKVKVGECDPCKILNTDLQVIATNMGSQFKYEPNLTDNPDYFYKWTFSDATTYSIRKVYKNAPMLSGSLTIYHGGLDYCCEGSVKFGKQG